MGLRFLGRRLRRKSENAISCTAIPASAKFFMVSPMNGTFGPLVDEVENSLAPRFHAERDADAAARDQLPAALGLEDLLQPQLGTPSDV